MSLPYHPLIVHFPVAISVILPILSTLILYFIMKKSFSSQLWIIALVFQGLTVATGYLALETGEMDEEKVEKVLSKKLIHEHEEAAEIFVGASVIVFVLGVLSLFIKESYRSKLRIASSVLSLVLPLLVYRAGHLGGELVYKHGAGNAFMNQEQEGLLPTPGKQTSESSVNESTKLDENDYGESSEVSDEVKEED